MPCTAAITGFQKSFDRGPMFLPGSSNMNGVADGEPTVLPLAGGNSSPIVSVRSIPVQNAFSPAAATTTALTSSFSRSARHVSRSSICIWRLNELRTSGRFSVIHATLLRSS